MRVQGAGGWSTGRLESAPRRYLAACGLALAAGAIDWVTSPHLGVGPFLPLAAAVFLSARYGGLGPGLLTTVLCAGAHAALLWRGPAGLPGSAVAFPAFAALGLLISWLSAARRRSLEEAEAARQRHARSEKRAAFLARAGALVSSSLEYRTTLENVARLAVPEFADFCVVDLIEPDGSLRRLALAHADPAVEAMAREAERRHPVDRHAPYGPGRALRTGQAELVSDLSDSLVRAVARDEEQLHALRALGLRSYICAPLRARDQMRGVLTFASTAPGRRYTPEDLIFAEDLARRAGLALDNARLYRESQEAVRLRDDFLSVASHELRTPLAALKLCVQGLVRLARVDPAYLLRPDHPERLGGYLDAALRQVDRLVRLLDSLLDVSRIAARRLQLDPEEVDLVGLVHDVAARFKEELVQAECELSIYADEAAPGMWDRLRLEQVVTNLISNAAKYGAGRPIAVTVLCEPQTARLLVRDQGIGVDPEVQGRIFERFERAVSGRNYGGLGLGLWITRSIVEAMGGTIRVESQPEVEHGATFVVELPRLPPATRAAETPSRTSTRAAPPPPC